MTTTTLGLGWPCTAGPMPPSWRSGAGPLWLVYIYCYVADRASLRSIVWLFGLGVVIRLFAMAF